MISIEKQSREDGFVFVVAAAVTICFLLASLLFVYKSGLADEQKSLQYLRDATIQRQAALYQQIEGDFQVLRGVAIGLAETDLSNQERLLALLDEVNRSNSFVRMGLARADGIADMVDLDGTVHTDVDLSRLFFFRTALEGNDSLSGTMPSPVTGLDVNNYAVPVYQGGEIAGVLCGANTFDILWGILNVPVFQRQGFFLIVDSEGLIVAPSTSIGVDMTAGSNITQSLAFSVSEQASFLKAIDANSSGSYVAEKTGEEVFVTNQPLWHNGWHVLSVVPRAGITAYYNQTAIGTAVIVLAASLLFILLLLWQKRIMDRNRNSLESLAYTDTLTGVSNQARFLLDAEHLLANTNDKKYAVWSFDINKFNNINDIFGSEVGDRVLIGVASVFAHVSQENSPFCRISGDFFAGLIAYREQQEIRKWCLQLWENLERQDVVPISKIRVSSAIGFYCIEDFPEEQLDVSNMISRASVARKQVKKIAKNEMRFFTGEMSKRLRWEAELEASGRLALENGEMTFFLQPKINIQNGGLIESIEALARWNHPVYGWISPEEFIPLFENSGFIVEFDRYIFKNACKWYASKHIEKSKQLQISINVSREGLLRTDFVEYYTKIKQLYAIPDGVLELEFTETCVMYSYDIFRSIVDELHKNGFICSIDDFGSGYSSLNVLKNLTIDVLKLDAAFLRGGVDPEREKTVICSCIRMARELGIKTVAEGVETGQQVSFLQRSGCDMVQGYYFSKPLSPPDFEHLLAETGGYLSPV